VAAEAVIAAVEIAATAAIAGKHPCW
jgi:hypothetical protein